MKKSAFAATLTLLIASGTAHADATFAALNYQVKQGDTTEGLGIGMKTDKK